MKMSDIPNRAHDAKPTEIPTKKVEVYDWAKLYTMIDKVGFVVLEFEEDEMRVTKLGTDEAAPVKAFNSWVRINYGHNIKTKRLSKNRWFVAL
jgi:hypothetical protein